MYIWGMQRKVFSLLLVFLPLFSIAQFDAEQTGAWYMYFFNSDFENSSFGFQGDVQHRNWDLGGDLEQLMLRGGLTYAPKNENIKFTLGYANITTGAFGDDQSTINESRIYQEALFPVKFGARFYTNHRFRYEQRWVEEQDLRTRYRYNFFLNIALNKKAMTINTLYLALYNEIFINGQEDIGNERRVELFDRNRSYLALGYVVRKGLKVQAGVMRQTTDAWTKDQLQVSLHQVFDTKSTD